MLCVEEPYQPKGIYMQFQYFCDAVRQHETKMGQGLYTFNELTALFPRLTSFEVERYLARATKEGMLSATCPDGLWRVKESETPIYGMFVRLVEFLRPNELNYVSLETVLSNEGIISQIPFVLTMSTTGSEGRYDTDVGSVEFSHTDAKREDLMSELSLASNGLLYASVSLAYQELKSLNLNLHLIDEEELAEAKMSGVLHYEGV